MNDTLDLFTEGERRKETALSDHENHKPEAIGWLRRQLIELYNDRQWGYAPNLQGATQPCVSADDARRLYEGSRFPAEYSKNRSFFGAVFRGKDWAVTGERLKSTHPGNHAHKNECWRYVGD